MLHGVDISKFQVDGSLPWTAIQSTSHFVICKASEGMRKDSAVNEHVKRVRGLKLIPGLYHFFRGAVPVAEQLRIFGDVADSVGLGAGDLIPALDWEGGECSVRNSALAEDFVKRACDIWGDCMVYITQRDWRTAGSPNWVLERPLWVAHYPGHLLPNPATPGHKPWRLWQYAVHPYAPGVWENDVNNPRAVDHNIALDPLPLITAANEAPAPFAPPSMIPIDWDYDEFIRARDEAVREK